MAPQRSWRFAAACGFVFAPMALLAADPPTKPERSDELPAALKRNVIIDRQIEARFDAVLAKVCDAGQCRVAVDAAAFAKQKIDLSEKGLIRIPRTVAPLGLVLQMVAREVGGTLRWDGGRLTITPGPPRDLRSFLSPPSRKRLNQVVVAVNLDRAVENAPMQDVLQFFSDKCDVTILIDDWAFRQEGMKEVGLKHCSLPSGRESLRTWLEKLAGQLRGHVFVGEEAILVVPHRTDISRLPAPALPPKQVNLAHRSR